MLERTTSSRSYFNPLPPCGGRRVFPQYSALVVMRFQSTPSVWRETPPAADTVPAAGFQSTPSVWRETIKRWALTEGEDISIHSLRVEGDESENNGKYEQKSFQSTPSVWRETIHVAGKITDDGFQSTPSVWRETAATLNLQARITDFNPLPPCGGRRLRQLVSCR